MNDKERAEWAISHLTRTYTELKTHERMSDEELEAFIRNVGLPTPGFEYSGTYRTHEDIQAALRAVADLVAQKYNDFYISLIIACLDVSGAVALAVEEQHPGVDVGDAIREVALKVANAEPSE